MNGADKARLRQVRTAILGNRPDTSVSSTLYPMYVAVIVTGSYGVPAAQSLFRSLDHQWLADHVWSPGGAVGAAILTALLLTLVRLVGRVRGPVMPPLPYLDLVIVTGSYGVPAAQSLFRSLDHQWLADHVWSPGGAVGAAILTALLLTLVRLV